MGSIRTAVGLALDHLAGLGGDPLEGPDLRKRTFVVAPHPDDETLGCGGMITRLGDLGTEVHVAFLTDGGGSHRGRMGAPELAALRRGEAAEAASRLGVPAERLYFLDAPDGSLERDRARVERAVRELLLRHRPEQVFAPYFREPPPDHQVTFELVRSAMTDCPGRLPLYGYPVWFWHRWPFVDRPRPTSPSELKTELEAALEGAYGLLFELRHRVDVAAALDRKRLALRAYRTQMTRFDDSPGWMILSDVAGGTWLDRMLTRHELFHRTCAGKGE